MKKLIPLLLLTILIPSLLGATDLSVDGNTVALYHMDGTVASAAKRDNAEGTSGLDLTEFNTPGSAAGHDGETDGAYDFDGTSDYLTTTGNIFNTETEFTWQACIKFNGNSGEDFVIDSTAGGSGVVLLYDGTNIKGRVRWSGGGGDQDTGTYAVSTGQYYSITLKTDGPSGTLQLFEGTTEVATKTYVGASGDLGTSAVGIGAAKSGGAPAQVTIDEVKFSNVNIADGDVTDYCNASAARRRVITF